MKRRRFMVVAGEASGDMLAAELVRALQDELSTRVPQATADHQPLQGHFSPEFFGAGGPAMQSEGVELLVDMTQHSATGLTDVFKKILEFRRIFQELKKAAFVRTPETIICVDFSGFNRRWARSLRRSLRWGNGIFNNWKPNIVQYVSPQVWASRAGRMYSMAEDLDLLLALFPFEKDWYAKRVPQLRVEFVGHPLLDRHGERVAQAAQTIKDELLLLPGSRPGELARHLPVLFPALAILRRKYPSLPARMVVPSAGLAAQARQAGIPDGLRLQIGDLPDALARARVAIASTGTVTMECALFGVPTVALYRTSWVNYEVGKRLVKVNWLAMPNILANAPVFPEFIQDAATPERLAEAALRLLEDEARRQEIQLQLAQVVQSLGSPGASRRAARAILAMPK